MVSNENCIYFDLENEEILSRIQAKIKGLADAASANFKKKTIEFVKFLRKNNPFKFGAAQKLRDLGIGNIDAVDNVEYFAAPAPEVTDLYDENGKLQINNEESLLNKILELMRSGDGLGLTKIYTNMKIGYKNELDVENHGTLGLKNNELLHIDRSLIISTNEHSYDSIFHKIPALFKKYERITGQDEPDEEKGQPLYKLSSEMNLEGPERLFICKGAVEKMSENEIKILFSQHLPKTKDREQMVEEGQDARNIRVDISGIEQS